MQIMLKLDIQFQSWMSETFLVLDFCVVVQRNIPFYGSSENLKWFPYGIALKNLIWFQLAPFLFLRVHQADGVVNGILCESDSSFLTQSSVCGKSDLGTGVRRKRRRG